MQTSMKYAVLAITSFLCLRVIAHGEAQPLQKPPLSLSELCKAVSLARKLMPSVKFSCKATVKFAGYWDDPKTDVTYSQSSSYEGDLVPAGRFKAQIDPYCTPWTDGAALLYGKTKTAVYDGEKTTTLVQKRGAYNDMRPSNEATIDSGNKGTDAELEQTFALESMPGISSFRGLSGDWSDMSSWASVPGSILKANKTDDGLLELVIIDMKCPDKLLPAERMEIQLKPKIGIKSYSDTSHNKDGTVASDYEITVLEFETSIPGPIMLPKKVMVSLKSKDPFGRNTERQATIEYSYDLSAPGSAPVFDVKIPQGYTVTDNRFGIQFRATSDVSDVIKSLRPAVK